MLYGPGLGPGLGTSYGRYPTRLPKVHLGYSGVLLRWAGKRVTGSLPGRQRMETRSFVCGIQL